MQDIPVEKTINNRHSCRTFKKKYLSQKDTDKLKETIDGDHTGPLGSKIRFTLTAASDDDTRVLKELGTYGFIKNPAGFIIGAITDGPHSLEDYGFLMERNILLATHMGIGTCWLGGSFTKSTFTLKIDAQETETVPAVVALGYPADRKSRREALIRWGAGSDRRKPWNELFFNGAGIPLTGETAGNYELPLEMVRRGPSASNKQPWRVFKENNNLHFFLERTMGYYNENRALFKMADIQRIDMGIAMCHFQLSAEEKGLKGSWKVLKEREIDQREGMDYTVTWQGN